MELRKRVLKPLPLLTPLSEIKLDKGSTQSFGDSGVVILIFQRLPAQGYIYCHGCGVGVPETICEDLGGVFCSVACSHRGCISAKVMAHWLNIPFKSMRLPGKMGVVNFQYSK